MESSDLFNFKNEEELEKLLTPEVISHWINFLATRGFVYKFSDQGSSFPITDLVSFSGTTIVYNPNKNKYPLFTDY